MTKLKPCPFCGSRAFMYQKKIQNGWLAEIACWHKYDDSFDGCAIKPSVSTVQKTEKEAHEVVKKAWNTRALISGKEEKNFPVWHTGTPTENGWYLLECSIGNSENTYLTTDFWSDTVGYWTVNGVIRWQKIDEYKEENK